MKTVQIMCFEHFIHCNKVTVNLITGSLEHFNTLWVIIMTRISVVAKSSVILCKTVAFSECRNSWYNKAISSHDREWS